jgi:group I intron endonuclease
MLQSGVYAITNTVNGKQYVGSSKHLGQRQAEHRLLLRKGLHPNRHLQAAFVRYGEQAFEYRILEECSPETMIAREQHWIDALDAICHGYNLRPFAVSNHCLPLTPEHRARLVAGTLKRWADPAARIRMSERSRALWADPEWRAGQMERLNLMQEQRKQTLAIGRAHRWANPAAHHQLAERSRALWADPEWHTEQVQRLRDGRWTDEQRSKQSQQNRERFSDPAQREVIRQTIRRTMSTPEYRARRSEISKRLWADPAFRARVAATQAARRKARQEEAA